MGIYLKRRKKFKSHSFSFDTFVRKEERKKRNAESCSKNPLYYLTEQNGCLFMLAAVILTKQHGLVQLDKLYLLYDLIRVCTCSLTVFAAVRCIFTEFHSNQLFLMKSFCSLYAKQIMSIN